MEHFSENGTYYVPSMTHEAEELEGLMEAGAVAFVHMTKAAGRSMADPSIFFGGLMLYFVVALVASALLELVGSSIKTKLDGVKFALLFGLLSALFIDIGDAVWWEIPLNWKVTQAVFNFSALFILMFVLATVRLRFSAGEATPLGDRGE